MAVRLTIKLPVAIILVWITGALSAFSQTRQVVVLYDERIDLPGLALFNAGFTNALTSGSPEHVEIFREEMDLSRFESPEYQDFLRKDFRARYAAKKIDVVVAVMAPAVDFVLSHRDEIFPGAAIVFSGLDRKELADRSLPADVTGVLIKREFAPTLDLVARLHPDTEQIAMVAGTSEFDTRLLTQAREEFKPFEKRFKITYLTSFSLPELLSRLSQLPPKTVVLYTTMFRDGAGQAHVPHDAVQRISAASTAPVYGFLDQYVGYGIVGGRVYRFGRHGEEAAALVVKILSGVKPQQLSLIEPANTVTMFDARQLQRWKINEDRLPPGSTVLYREPTVWQLYRWWIIGGLSVFVVEAALIAGLVVNRVRRRRAEGSLVESEGRFQVMADATPVLIWMVGPDKLTTFFNQAWLDFTGRTMEQDRGNGWREVIHPDDLEEVLKQYGKAFDAREPFLIQCRLRRKDGAHRWVTSSGIPRYDAAGGFLGYIGASVDVTELQEKDSALHDFEQRVTLAAEAAHLGVWELDAKTGEFWASDSFRKLYDFQPEERVSYQSFLERIHPEDRPERDAVVQRAIETNGDYEMEYRIVLPDGTIRWASGRARCMPHGTTKSTRLVGVSMDVTERKQAEGLLRRRQDQIELLSRISLLGEMTASVAHELNQPLSAIMINASTGQRLMARGNASPESLHEILADVAADAQRAHDVMQNVRNTIKKGPLVKQQIDLNHLVTSVTHLIHATATAHECEVTTSLAPNLPKVEGDPIQIQQVLINLLNNAFEAMNAIPPRNRRVEITTHNGGSTVSVSVRDHGVGIPDGAKTRLFEQFFTTKEQGLGMGLAIVRSIVETHGGRITAENAEADGARFSFTMPAAK